MTEIPVNEIICGDRKIKAISLHQPWASWIAQGKKTIETRTWPTNHRGDLLIVSTKSPKYHDFPLGKALCVVEVIGCRKMKRSDEKAARCQWDCSRYAWLLANIRPIVPFAVKGSQGFYEIQIKTGLQVMEKVKAASQKGLFE